MKAWKISAITAFCSLVWMGATVQGQIFSRPQPPVQKPIPVLQPPPGSFLYPQNETLTYSVHWRVFTAGTAVFHLERTGDIE